jgi:prepilin-type N-terminal cleavage/methylation domain-containing protein
MWPREEEGFTLIEVIVGLIVVSLFMLGAFVFQHDMLTFSRQGTARADLQQQGMLALEYMIRGVREASTVSIGDWEGGTNNGITVTTPDGTRSYWSVEDAGARQDNLYMNQGSGEELLIGDYSRGGFGIKVAALSFSDNYDGADPTTNTVDIDLSLKLLDLTVVPAVTLETMDFDSQVQPRNR